MRRPRRSSAPLPAVRAGRPTPPSGRTRAQLVVAAAEGAVAMCRTQRGTQPLDDVAKELTALLESVIEART
ncbi:hypothetical protein [Lentzea roselyniae]|uniref:LmrA/YxaF family transcription factor n=1 Tax=Lentzea roselyniae TaxID=531940 RepID=UPI003D159B7C